MKYKIDIFTAKGKLQVKMTPCGGKRGTRASALFKVYGKQNNAKHRSDRLHTAFRGDLDLLDELKHYWKRWWNARDPHGFCGYGGAWMRGKRLEDAFMMLGMDREGETNGLLWLDKQVHAVEFEMAPVYRKRHPIGTAILEVDE